MGTSEVRSRLRASPPFSRALVGWPPRAARVPRGPRPGRGVPARLGRHAVLEDDPRAAKVCPRGGQPSGDPLAALRSAGCSRVRRSSWCLASSGYPLGEQRKHPGLVMPSDPEEGTFRSGIHGLWPGTSAGLTVRAVVARPGGLAERSPTAARRTVALRPRPRGRRRLPSGWSAHRREASSYRW